MLTEFDAVPIEKNLERFACYKLYGVFEIFAKVLYAATKELVVVMCIAEKGLRVRYLLIRIVCHS